MSKERITFQPRVTVSVEGEQITGVEVDFFDIFDGEQDPEARCVRAASNFLDDEVTRASIRAALSDALVRYTEVHAWLQRAR